MKLLGSPPLSGNTLIQAATPKSARYRLWINKAAFCEGGDDSLLEILAFNWALWLAARKIQQNACPGRRVAILPLDGAGSGRATIPGQLLHHSISVVTKLAGQ